MRIGWNNEKDAKQRYMEEQDRRWNNSHFSL